VLLLEAGPAYRRAEYPEVMLDPERISGDQEHDWGLRATVAVRVRSSARSPHPAARSSAARPR